MAFLADISAGAVGGLLSGIGSLAKDIRQAWTGEISPDKRAEIELKLAEIEAQSQQGQLMINIEEAKSGSTFVAGARPFIMWSCGFALCYASIVEPLMSWIATVCFHYTGTFPKIDTTITTQILCGLLGLGAMRSVDKYTTGKNPTGT